eukprot:TRINITY_DN11297_c0_g1_i1.p1 TRINITY_DN11297_c0_g1~~TRINITY_DN11297_c0_g1_i1.p1  ORF type:complete len:460 (+),score=121.16 TRINITY_DN11297_c0_g1_i1:48-1382(+)
MAFTKQEEQRYVDYLNGKGVPALMDEILESCCKEMPEDPVSYVTGFLAEKRCRYPPESQLGEISSIEDAAGAWEGWCQGTAMLFTERKAEGQGCEVVVGCDGRKVNRKKLKTLAKCLVANGLKVLVPDGYYATRAAMDSSIAKTLGGVYLYSAERLILLPDGTCAAATPHDVCVLVKDMHAAEYEGKIKRHDAVCVFANEMEQRFKLSNMRSQQGMAGMKLLFDCEHGVAGPYAREIFVNRLGLAEPANVELLNETPWEEKGKCSTKDDLSKYTIVASCGQDGTGGDRRSASGGPVPRMEERLFVEHMNGAQCTPSYTDGIEAVLAFMSMLLSGKGETLDSIMERFPDIIGTTTSHSLVTDSHTLPAALSKVSQLWSFSLEGEEKVHVEAAEEQDDKGAPSTRVTIYITTPPGKTEGEDAAGRAVKQLNELLALNGWDTAFDSS